MPKTPPNIDGIMTLTDSEVSTIKSALEAIQTAFAPTDDVPVCDTFYLVATYNKQNVGHEINGDTAEYVLSYVQGAV